MIRVFIADDQLLVRQGIRALLELDDSIRVVGEAGDGGEAVERVSQAAVDVLLLDIRMPRKSGIEVLRELGTRGGARGFMLKDVSYDQLIAAIRAVAEGGTLFQPAVTERLLRAAGSVHVGTEARPERLTEREIEVVRLMSGGYSNREIGRALGAAEGTIKNHVSSILAKLGVRDRTRAVLKALEIGLLNPR